MAISFVYVCDECGATAQVTAPRREFVGLTGRSYGFGGYQFPTPKGNAPQGWIDYCIVGCTYCPQCADKLTDTEAKP